MTTFQDRVRGVAAGVALGDAMGAPVEKLTFAQIQQQYGKVESIMTRWYKADWDEEERFRLDGAGVGELPLGARPDLCLENDRPGRFPEIVRG
ncbi:MAG: hypothetical protein C6W55_04135 [Thermobacillus sp.]|uniref:ADP-ribosylglycohydrolase family protein n=1 Tax=Thermobacillus sp. TaxID=2108467 RepID=UPI000E3A74BA|nr:ADP-ribosylglycohydrolase family protein [Thermobacillus sp.]REK58048.1 MAG: hypothetical protein C6W55_04135 [Thermobacillus sp.]